MQEMQECKEQERCCSRTCTENTVAFDFWNPRCASRNLMQMEISEGTEASAPRCLKLVSSCLLINIRRRSKCLPLKGKFPQLLKGSFKAVTHLSHPALSPVWPLPASVTNPTQTAHIQNILALFCF